MAVPNPKFNEHCLNCKNYKYDKDICRGRCSLNNQIVPYPMMMGGSMLCKCYCYENPIKEEPVFEYPKENKAAEKPQEEEKLRISDWDDFFVMKDGKVIANKTLETPIPNGTKSRIYSIKDGNKLYTSFHCSTDDGFCSHGWWEKGEYIGEVEYTFSLQDVEDARFLAKMAFFFPNLEPQNVSATLKKVFEESRDEEAE